MTTKHSLFAVIALSLGLTGMVSGCRPDKEEDADPASTAKNNTVPLRAVLTFPPELQVDDRTVNEFITKAMHICAEGDYDSFRLLWSAREELITKGEYEKGWKAVERIDIRALEKVKLAPDPAHGETVTQTVYAVYADVIFDPTQTAVQQDPERHVVLVVLRVHDTWRLGTAPRELRAWLTDKISPKPDTRPQTETRPRTELRP